MVGNKEEEKHWLEGTLKHFKWIKSIDEENLKRVEKQLEERERLGKERGVEEESVPEGYLDIGKDLKEQRELIKERLKGYDKTIENIRKLSYFV